MIMFLIVVAIVGVVSLITTVMCKTLWRVEEDKKRPSIDRRVAGVMIALVIQAPLLFSVQAFGRPMGLWRATMLRDLPAQVIYEKDNNILLKYTETGQHIGDPCGDILIVAVPQWLEHRQIQASRPEFAGQTWLIEEKVMVAGKTMTQPVLVTYTTPGGQ